MPKKPSLMNMKKYSLLFLLFLPFFTLTQTTLAQTAQWVFNIGGSGVDACNRMALDGDGNLILTGSFEGADVDFDPGPGQVLLSSAGSTDVFVAKYSPNGNLLWASRTGDAGDDAAYGIAVDNVSGNIYICGYSQSTGEDPGDMRLADPAADRGYTDIFFSCFNAAGSLLWTKKITGTNYNTAYSCCIDINHDLLVTGYFTGSAVDFDPGPGTAILTGHGNLGNIFLARYDSDGNYKWAFAAGGTMFDAGQDITSDNEANMYLCGNIASSDVDFDPGNGTYLLSPVGTSDAYLASYDVAGNFRWAFNMRCAGSAVSSRVAIDKNGNVCLAGNFSLFIDTDPGILENWLNSIGNKDVFYGKYSGFGQLIWAYNIGSIEDDNVFGLGTDEQGRVYLAGNFRSGSNDFDPGPVQHTLSYYANNDLFFARYGADGSYNWARSIKGPENETATGILPGNSNSVYLTGSFSGENIDFNPAGTTLLLSSNSGSQDFFAGKYIQEPDGVTELSPGSFLNIYPNPASGDIHISTGTIPVSHELIRANLFSADGRIMTETEGTISKIETDLSRVIRELPEGIYFLNFKNDRQNQTSKIIVK
jgi:hypothetical protein